MGQPFFGALLFSISAEQFVQDDGMVVLIFHANFLSDQNLVNFFVGIFHSLWRGYAVEY